ncbi:3-oxoadipate enol-lactonase [Antricoccus suffuscus]|uniref:3-oxoadipate enol-lactonase n=1 Tax=Antricoccus suffuscus TaxID=1629062 RepID=A0A2T1A142_9ACTN|nr:alpha/beta hydrolase [Antricoccus suffuscus]PRZ42322.1 3-oxoadipate enol-lactonase [Antricoccus suffuscus]
MSSERVTGEGKVMTESNILFLHPVGLDHQSSSWTTIPKHRAVTFPGHGDRTRSRPGLTLDDMADEIVGWVHEPVHVVGASMGGMVALHLALKHPDAVLSLVLACTSAGGKQDVMEARAATTEERGAEGMLQDTLTRWFTTNALAQTDWPDPMVYARERLLAMDTGALADTWRALGGHDVWARLGEIAAPATCLAGTHDVSSPPAIVRKMAAGLAQSRYCEIDAPHMAHLENPVAFSDAVNAHFEWVGAKNQ